MSLYKPKEETPLGLRYKSQEEAIKDHVDNYRSDGVAKGKATHLSADYYRGDFIVSHVPKGSNVLDVGCNGGTIGIHLLQRECFVKGIDIVEDLVNKAKERGIYAEVGCAEDLSRYKDNEFDIVICAEVLEHLFDPLPAIKEAYRVLKPGGTYIVTIPAPTGVMAKERLGDYHQQNFTMEMLDTLFYSVFPRDSAYFYQIPYSDKFCKANAKTQEEYEKLSVTPQWIGITATKEGTKHDD
jgi:2-polyprenyl-3-methyl-5-hydroxy-6-metoxy-1,4-benzoquinol methylase